jgi:Thiamine pyrophosphate enzyme, central domain
VTITAGQLLARVLAVNGIDGVYGTPLSGVEVTPVGDPAVAELLAVAHRRVHRSAAAVSHGDGRLSIGAVGADRVPQRVIGDAAELLDPLPAAVSLRLELDLDAPAPDRVPTSVPVRDRWIDADPADAERLCAASAPAVLAGPGVVSEGAVDGLNAFATAGDVGVLNTWGAKGVFHWRSRHHWATVGLQADDYRLGGFDTADLIVATGVDPDEAPAEHWQLAPVLTVVPGALGPLSELWRRPRGQLAVPPLRAGLAAATQEGWAGTVAPLPPSRITLHYGTVFGSGGLVAADPGIAGYWVARTFSTTELGSALVPARRGRGFAAACALVARLRRPRRPVLAAVDALSGPVTAVLDAAASLGIAVPLEIWDDEAPGIDADTHLERLRRLAVADAPVPVRVATDGRQLDRMIDVAGPVVAWGGLGR